MTEAERFAGYVAALGRGPGRSRALTREEARDAFALVLAGAADPHQVGAFLMLLRYRGETADELAGFVEAARAALPVAPVMVDLDWPSYGAGRTRGLPWYLLAALALSASGVRVLMHGSNEFSSGVCVAEGLAALGLRPARHAADAARLLDATNFAYLPLATLHPALDGLLGLRRLLGLRSPANTVARLLDPFDARAGLGGVFHPSYLELHVAAAQALGRPSLLLVKGAGGEAERNPAKPTRARLHRRGAPTAELDFPALFDDGEEKGVDPERFVAVWSGACEDEAVRARIVGTIALALCALDPALSPAAADIAAAKVWDARLNEEGPPNGRPFHCETAAVSTVREASRQATRISAQARIQVAPLDGRSSRQ